MIVNLWNSSTLSAFFVLLFFLIYFSFVCLRKEIPFHLHSLMPFFLHCKLKFQLVMSPDKQCHSFKMAFALSVSFSSLCFFFLNYYFVSFFFPQRSLHFCLLATITYRPFMKPKWNISEQRK